MLSDPRYLVSGEGRDYWAFGDPNDVNFLQAAPLPGGRDSACHMAVLPLHAQPVRRRGDDGEARFRREL